MAIIKANNLLKDYGDNKGVFNLNFEIKKGQVVGFLGPNGAGKTTAIRFLLGLISNKESSSYIKSFNTFNEQVKIQTFTGYLPGEITFIDNFNALEFLHFMAKLKNVSNLDYAHELIHLLDLNLNLPIKKMSKGMKQKLGLVIAFMAKPEILILDEPSSGLDPLMQQKLISLILKHQALGATIFLSSHIFEEVEKVCDRVMIIKDGVIVADHLIDDLKKHLKKSYLIEFSDKKEALKFLKASKGFKINDTTVEYTIKDNINNLIKNLNNYNVVDITRKEQSIEEIFLKYYGDSND